ncbi:GNAT family N-acetyltransferase [Haloarchaeobius sp. HRN-SO-5]|uniref:GNAT family N-acetyltransferase n=1 Tax=Haloarchaeobius sp. HRN-SO-5 TaxID=3446118 RepID=UPI003EBF90BE
MSQSTSVRPGEREREREHDEYVVRPYESRDAEDVRRLYETVWGNEPDDDWLTYKFETSPYLDGTPMLVAETDGDVVGARPAVPVPMRAGLCDLTAVYLVSLMVHPDHRRRGLFTRMMARGLERYAEAGASVCFNFGNESSAPGYRQLGFETLGTGPHHHVRVQRPGPFVEARVPSPVGRLAAPVANAATRAYRRARRPGRPGASRWTVERRTGVAADQLARLYDPRSTRTVHTRREPTFYRWLDANPNWEYVTYRATDCGETRAALLVKRRPGEERADPTIVDAVPRVSAATRPAFEALLREVLVDHRDAATVSVKGLYQHERLFPDDLLSRFGFHSTRHPVLSRVTADEYTVFVRPLDGAGERIVHETGVDLLNSSDWRVRTH